MKNTKIFMLMSVGMAILVSCNSGSKEQGQEAQEIPFEELGEQQVARDIIPENHPESALLELTSDSYDFGTIKEGDNIEHEFTFTNTGGSPLIISNVQASCGCTTPEYSKTPIAPGETGLVKVVFNSAGQVGKQHKIVTVTSNALSTNTLLHLRGEVIK